MPDLSHLEKLVQGVAAWNGWRVRDPSVIPDLTAMTLTLSQRQMGFSHGGPINLRYALLQDADFRFATLTGADLEGADLSRANLADARLDGANLTAADLSGASLDKVDFSDAVLERTNLAGANLRGACHLTQAQLSRAMGDAGTTLPGHLTRPPHWLLQSASAEFEERKTEGPYIAPRERDQEETRNADWRSVAKIAADDNVLFQTTQQAALPETLNPSAFAFRHGLNDADVEAARARLNGPRAGSRTHRATVIGLGLFLAVLGLAWTIATSLLDERSAILTAPPAAPIESESLEANVAPRPTPESEASVGDADRAPGRPVPSAELGSPAPVLLDAPAAPSARVLSPNADAPPAKAREAPKTDAWTVRVEQSAPPSKTRASAPRSSDDVPKPRPRKPAELTSREAASDVLTGGLQ